MLTSGVRSLSPKPVPPVVNIQSSFRSHSSLILPRILSVSSGTIADAARWNPRRCRISWISAPDLSSLTPACTLSLTLLLDQLLSDSVGDVNRTCYDSDGKRTHSVHWFDDDIKEHGGSNRFSDKRASHYDAMTTSILSSKVHHSSCSLVVPFWPIRQRSWISD